jgi:hypothetical protein
MDSLEKIAPIPVRLDVAGERLSLTPIKTKELPALMKTIMPVFGEIASGDILGAIMANADAAIESTAICIRKDRAWLDDLELDDLVRVAGAAMEVNADFFASAILPTLTVTIERIKAVLGPKQSMPSPD